jgi:4-amino-4-deoxy-L-arabinose transferase-like glycosyltransferase
MNHRSFAPQWCWVLRISLVILGLFAVVTAYFWAHKPFDADVVAGLARSLTSIVAWLGINWLGAALGRRVSGELLLEERPSTRLALSAGIGLGLVSLLMLGLGLVGYLRPGVAWGLVLVLGILLWRDLWAILTDLRLVRLPWPASGFQYWLMAYGGVSLLLIFLVALAPPTGWDTLVYHLTGPRIFVEAGRIIHPIDLPYLGFPQLGEMQITLGLLLVGDGVAPLLHFGYGLLALVITASLAHRAFGKDVAWLAVALLLSVPTFLTLMARAYVDATLLFYGTAAVYALVCWRERRVQGSATPGRGWLMMMGLFCGFCGGIKYTAVLIPVALGLSLIWISRHDRPLTTAGGLALVAAITVAAALPWLLENWMTTGNPVYPFFFADGIYWDEWRGWWFDRPGTGLATTAPWRLLTAPLEATVLGTEGTVLYDATIGPLLLTSMALLAAVWHSLSQEERAIAGHLLLFFGVNYALWLSGLGRTAMLLETRLLFLVFGAAAVLGGLALDRLRNLRRPQLDVVWVVRAVMSLTLALLLFSTFTTFLEINPLPVVLGLESPDDYLARRLGWYYVAVQNINRELPPGAVVGFFWVPPA